MLLPHLAEPGPVDEEDSALLGYFWGLALVPAGHFREQFHSEDVDKA